MKSIKTRLVATYLIIILLTAMIFDLSTILLLRRYYMVNIKDILTKQAETSAELFKDYFSVQDLDENVNRTLDSISDFSAAQVLLIDLSGNLIADSIGYYSKGDHIDFPDVKAAINGVGSDWHGKLPISGEEVIAVSIPLKKSEDMIGIIRFISSISTVQAALLNISFILALITIAVILISALVSIIISVGITKPVKDITKIAEKMARGNFTERIEKHRDDEIGKLTDTLNYMADEIVNHQQLKDNFIASVSHELRTPLTSVKGWAITLRTGDIINREELMEGLSIIESESNRLSLLVEELLDFSKFAAGRLTLNLDEVDIGLLIINIEKQLRPRFERQGIIFKAVYGELPGIIKADKNRLKQVMINLLDNAIKFTPAGGSVEIRTDEYEGFIRIQVIDTGSGIDRGDLERVKQKFFKCSKNVSGSGLGLAISDELITLHGGTITLTSELGKGTNVNVLIPTGKYILN